jgi:hypothetical protein
MAGKKKIFSAILESSGDIDAAFISIPFDVEKEYGTKGQVKVKATFDGYPYRGVLANMGTGCHVIGVRKDIRKAIGKKPGDYLDVEIEADKDDRVVDLPPELKTLLEKNKASKKFFDSLSFTNRKEYAVWISSAKKEETKAERLKKTLEKLLNGRKNPSDNG